MAAQQLIMDSDEEFIKTLLAAIEEEKDNTRLVRQLEGHLHDAYKRLLSSRATRASHHSIAKRQRKDEDEEDVENEKDEVGYLHPVSNDILISHLTFSILLLSC